MLYDISPNISPRINVWPGDTPATREVLLDLSRGDTVTLSTLRTTVHLGAHADGPNHYDLGGRDIASMALQPVRASNLDLALEHYLGPCRVLGVRGPDALRGGRVRIDDLVDAGGASGRATLENIREARVLVRTETFPDHERWNTDFAALSPELIDALAALPIETTFESEGSSVTRRGVVTIGIDTPSVDPQSSKTLEAHKTIAGHDIAILEGLRLARVALGVYELIALPLRLESFDASPVRAVLRTM